MDFTFHRIRKHDRFEFLSAYYRVPVCMIMRANSLNDAEGFNGLKELKIPKRCYCNKCGGGANGLEITPGIAAGKAEN
jgi:hypothetical protein